MGLMWNRGNFSEHLRGLGGTPLIKNHCYRGWFPGEHCFSNFNVLVNHPTTTPKSQDLIKIKILFQWVWNGAEFLHLSQASWWCPCCWCGDPTLCCQSTSFISQLQVNVHGVDVGSLVLVPVQFVHQPPQNHLLKLKFQGLSPKHT